MTSMQPRRLRRLVVVLMLIAAMASAVIALWPREALLLKLATPMARRSPDIEVTFATWISAHEYAELEWPGDTSLPLNVLYHDLTTGKTRRVPIQGCAGRNHLCVELAPDGRYALYWWGVGNGGPVYTQDLQTGRARRWDFTGDIYDTYHYDSLWLSDSRVWLELFSLSHGYLQLHSADAPQRPIRLPFPDYQNATRFPIYHEYFVTRQCHLLVYDRANRDGSENAPWSRLSIREYNLTSPITSLRTLHVALPDASNIVAIAFSPAGDRVALAYVALSVAPLTLWLHRWLPTLPLTPQYRFVVGVVRIPGGELHEIGHINLPYDSEEFSDLRWLPGEKRLSFGYKNTLYTVAAP